MKSTHFDESGRAHMVDVSSKGNTLRIASARGRVIMKAETVNMIKEGLIGKGDVLAVAQVAGIMAAKNTSGIIPMCHNLPLAGADIRFAIKEKEIDIESEIKTTNQTGVEMEALMAVSAAALTIYDMCKSVDRGIIISDIMLVKKRGGKSGEYIREE